MLRSRVAVMGGMVVSDKGREPWLGSRRSFLSAWATGTLGSGGSGSLGASRMCSEHACWVQTAQAPQSLNAYVLPGWEQEAPSLLDLPWGPAGAQPSPADTAAEAAAT